MKYIDAFLNTITMYRLVLYYLLLLIAVACVFGYLGILHYSPVAILLSTVLLVLVSWLTNTVFAKVFNAPVNTESVYITALILALIVPPIQTMADVPLVLWAAVLSMASKYILAINKKHLFNPAAIAVVLTAFGLNASANWWIGTVAMLPFSLLGFLIVRKIRRTDLVFYFFVTALLTIVGFSIVNGQNVVTSLRQTLLLSPIFFFAFVMLTEPLTTPPTKGLQSIYGALVGFLFAPQVHIGTWYTTPEIALVLGNVYSYLVSPKQKLLLHLKEKLQYGTDIIDFTFPLAKKFSFIPGQYMEFTLPHANVDSRGNRRYFTIASSPTERELKLGVRFSANGSSYKEQMRKMTTKTQFVAAQLAGDFTLPKNKKQPCVFIAGGIGITPYRSMIKYLIDTNEPRPITLFYAARSVEEFAYTDVFQQAQQQLGIRTVYIISNKNNVPANWHGQVGYIDTTMIKEEVSGYKNCLYYISGSQTLVDQVKNTLQHLHIHNRQIKTDYFPGLA